MMKQNLTAAELAAALRVARLTPASTSPLANVPPAAEIEPALMQSLRAKSVLVDRALAPEWQRALITLVDPQQQATAFFESIGAARYFGGAGGVATLSALADGQQQLVSGITREALLAELNGFLSWRNLPDGPPQHVEISVEELAAIAALADAGREEQLRAVIERRPPVAGKATFADLERQVVTGVQRPDRHWLVSVLTAFAPVGSEPNAAALRSGAESLNRRGWIVTRDGVVQFGAQVEMLCSAFATVQPFLALAVGAPWRDPEISIFTRGIQAFWGVEFRSEEAPSRRVSIVRLGARAMDEALTRRFGPLWSSSAMAEPARPVASATPPPQPRIQPPPPPVARQVPAARPPVPSQTATVSPTNGHACAACGKPLKPGSKFCTSCGKPVTAERPASQPAVCPNPKCGRPITPGTKFCTTCGTRLAQVAKVQ